MLLILYPLEVTPNAPAGMIRSWARKIRNGEIPAALSKSKIQNDLLKAESCTLEDARENTEYSLDLTMLKGPSANVTSLTFIPGYDLILVSYLDSGSYVLEIESTNFSFSSFACDSGTGHCATVNISGDLVASIKSVLEK